MTLDPAAASIAGSTRRGIVLVEENSGFGSLD